MAIISRILRVRKMDGYTLTDAEMDDGTQAVGYLIESATPYQIEESVNVFFHTQYNKIKFDRKKVNKYKP